MTLKELLEKDWEIKMLTTEKQSKDSLIVSAYAAKKLDTGSEVQFEFTYDALHPDLNISVNEENYGIKPSGSDSWVNIGIEYLNDHSIIANYLESGIK